MNLETIRSETDKIDDAIAELFEKRLKLVASVAPVKMETRSPIFSPSREREIIGRLTKPHARLVVLHIFFAFFCSGSENVPGSREIVDSLEADPCRLRTRQLLLSRRRNPTAQFADQPNHLVQRRRLFRQRLLRMHHPIRRLPLRFVKQNFAAPIRMTPTETTDQQNTPRNNQIHAQARFQTARFLELQRFHLATRFQGLEKDFNHPSAFVVFDHLQNVFQRIDRKRRQQEPFDRRFAGRRRRFGNRNDVHRQGIISVA